MPSKPGNALERVGEQFNSLAIRAVNEGVGPLAGSAAYARDRLSRTEPRRGELPPDGEPTASGEDASGDPEAAIRRIIRESVASSGVQGFVNGLGGLPTMPLTLPANMAGSLIINARMVGAIAYLRGYELNDPHTQAMIILTAAGSTAQGALSEFGVTMGKQAAKQALEAVPRAVIHKINRKAGFYLLAKYGTQRSAVTLVKFVPGVGGLVGGGVDAALTRAIGHGARRTFPREGN